MLLKELWIVFFSLFLIVLYMPGKFKSGGRFSHFELYILFIIIITPLWSGLAAWREFGQPLLFGVLPGRNIVLVAGALAVIYMIRKRWVSIRDFDAVLSGLAWASLIIYVLIRVAFDPSQFTDIGKGFVGGGNVSEASFKFDVLFIVFGFYYYIFQGFRRKSKKYYLYGAIFLAYLVFMDGGRSLILSVIGAWAYFILRWVSTYRILLLAPKFFIVGVLLAGILIALSPHAVLGALGKFGDAVSVVTMGEKSNDISANARLLESAIAFPYIQKHWLVGNGNLSNQWHGGYEGVLGYFYPSDIGIIGVLYMYGMLGLCLFLYQYYFLIRFSRRLSDMHRNSPLLDALKGFLLYFLIHSLVTGRLVLYAEISFLFIALLFGMIVEVKRTRMKRKVCYV